MMDFTLPLLQTNKRWNLRDEAAGRPVMLTFWTSWCPDSFRDLQEKKDTVSACRSIEALFYNRECHGERGRRSISRFCAETRTAL